jgi:hypothetical protein
MKSQASLHDISAYDFLSAIMYDVNVNQEKYHEFAQEKALEDVAEHENNTRLINAIRSSSKGNILP